jgi:hypothetical protein
VVVLRTTDCVDVYVPLPGAAVGCAARKLNTAEVTEESVKPVPPAIAFTVLATLTVIGAL